MMEIDWARKMSGISGVESVNILILNNTTSLLTLVAPDLHRNSRGVVEEFADLLE